MRLGMLELALLHTEGRSPEVRARWLETFTLPEIRSAAEGVIARTPRGSALTSLFRPDFSSLIHRLGQSTSYWAEPERHAELETPVSLDATQLREVLQLAPENSRLTGHPDTVRFRALESWLPSWNGRGSAQLFLDIITCEPERARALVDEVMGRKPPPGEPAPHL